MIQWSEKEALGHIAAAYRGDTSNPEALATYIDWPWRYQVAAIIDGFPVAPTASFVYTGGTLVDSVFGSIPTGWQESNTDINQLVLGTSVTTIGSSAFESCSSLVGSLTIPNSVKAIRTEAFRSTGFTSLTLGSSLISIGSYAFSYCSNLIGPLTIPNSVTSIGNYAFKESGWNGTYPLTIPGTVSLSEDAFNGASFNGLTITGTSINANLINDKGALFMGSLTISNTVTSIGSYAFGYDTLFTSLTLGNSITSIGSSAFRGCTGLTGSLTIPNSVTSIGSYAFYNCSFTGSLTIPNSVTTIGSQAFYGCTGFTGSLTIPNSATTIGDSAFRICESIADAYLNQPLSSIGSNAFESSALTTVHLRPSPNTPAGWTIGSGQTIGGNSGVTVVANWTTYPNPP